MLSGLDGLIHNVEVYTGKIERCPGQTDTETSRNVCCLLYIAGYICQRSPTGSAIILSPMLNLTNPMLAPSGVIVWFLCGKLSALYCYHNACSKWRHWTVPALSIFVVKTTRLYCIVTLMLAPSGDRAFPHHCYV